MLKRNKEKQQGPPPIEGINVAAVTPRRERLVEVDLGAMLELVDFIGGYPVQGITVFGTTGEFVHFTIEERSRYVSLLAKRSRVPVMANVSHSTLDGAVMMAEEAAGAGIAAVLVMPPHYFRYSPEAVETYCLEFAERIARWVPVYLYHIPQFTDAIPVEVADRLLASGAFAGIKDSSGDWARMERLLELRRMYPFTVMAGNDRIFARARRAGANGGVTGVGGAIPELMLALDRAVVEGRPVEQLDGWLQEFIGRIDEFPAPVGVRAAVAARGIQTGPHASPLGPELSARLREFESWFKEWLPGVLAGCKVAGLG